MRADRDKRIIKEAEFIVANKSTVRETAKNFGISKSCVHHDLTVSLKDIDKILYRDVQRVIRINKEQRHLRGGVTTKSKYSKKE